MSSTDTVPIDTSLVCRLVSAQFPKWANLPIKPVECGVDLAIAWTLFKGESRDVFRSALKLDSATWARGSGWALWKALFIYTHYT